MRKPNSSVTHEEILHLLDYDPETGIFVWKNPSKYQPKQKGCVAGRIDSGGYRQIAIDNLRYNAARLAWFYVNGAWPSDLVDHINGNRDDNRIENLRECCHAENAKNRKMRCDNGTGFKGVTQQDYKGKASFRATIQSNGEQIHLGMFDTAEEAHAAYAAASQRHHGEFGRSH